MLFVDFLHSYFIFIVLYSRWGQSLLCIIRQQNKTSSSSSSSSQSYPLVNETNDQNDHMLSPDQAAHARACAK